MDVALRNSFMFTDKIRGWHNKTIYEYVKDILVFRKMKRFDIVS